VQKDSVLRGTPTPLFFKAATGLTVEALVQHPDFPGETAVVSLSELPTAAGHIKVYVATFTPEELGWYHVTFRAYSGDTTIATDATRFYSYSEAEQSAGATGEPVLQEISVKVGELATLVYRGIVGLTVDAKVVFQADLADPSTGLVLEFELQPTPTGFKPMYLATFAPTREGKYYVYVKTLPTGGEALIVVNAFRTLPYSRAAGTVKSSATSTVT
jgi:hypothetical protein